MMTKLKDINDKADIKILVDLFYEKVRIDPKIGAVFAARIKEHEWPQHLERMYSFWNTVLFGQMDYRGNPFSKHQSLPIFSEHFEKWIKLFNDTVNENFKGPKADEALDRAKKMALMFLSKLVHIRSNESYKNII